MERQESLGKTLSTGFSTWHQGKQMTVDIRSPTALPASTKAAQQAQPTLPGGQGAAKAATAQRQRLKASYALLVTHELDADHLQHMRQNHFQDGPAAWAYMNSCCAVTVGRLQLKDMDAEWNNLNMLEHVGVSPNSVTDAAKKIKALNAKRPVANRKSPTLCGEKLLEILFQCLKHFSESTLIEYNAQPADWQFAYPPGHAQAGQRNFDASTAHYHLLGKQAVDSKLPGFHTRGPSAAPAKPMRTKGLNTGRGNEG